MHFTTLNSGSQGNCYLLTDSKGKTLVIEAGVKLIDLKKAVNFNIKDIAGCIITHQHQDHCKYLNDYMKNGIKCYVNNDHFDIAATTYKGHNLTSIQDSFEFDIDGFWIRPFNVKHDVKCLGFLIWHEEMGTTLFLTDSKYSPYTFKGLNNIIVEANYCEDIIKRKHESGNLESFLHDRVLNSHMSIQTCEKLLQANDLTNVVNIVLIHLSNSNSNKVDFINRIKKTGKRVSVAETGLKIELNKTLF